MPRFASDDPLDQLLDEHTKAFEEAKELLEATKTLQFYARKHPDLFVRIAATINTAGKEDESGRTQLEVVRDFLSQHEEPIETSVIQIATGLSPSAIRTVLYGNPSLFQPHQHPDHSTKRRWSLKRDGQTPDEPEATLPGPTDAVLDYLRGRPSGATAKMIVRDLDGKVHTKSDDPTNVIYGTVAMLERRGKIVAIRDAKNIKYYNIAPGEDGGDGAGEEAQ